MGRANTERHNAEAQGGNAIRPCVRQIHFPSQIHHKNSSPLHAMSSPSVPTNKQNAPSPRKMITLSTPRALRSLSGSTPTAKRSPPVTTTITPVLHLSNGTRHYLDQRNISKPRLEFLSSQHKRTRGVVPTGDFRLPLDLRTFLIDRRQTPRCLWEFVGQAEALMVQLRATDARLETMRDAARKGDSEAVRADFCAMVSAAMDPLRSMLWILKRLEKECPTELRTNRHAIEEWREDTGLVMRKVAKWFVEAARAAETTGLDEAAKVLARMRKPRLLKWVFESVVSLDGRQCPSLIVVLSDRIYIPHPEPAAGRPPVEIAPRLEETLVEKVWDFVDEQVQALASGERAAADRETGSPSGSIFGGVEVCSPFDRHGLRRGAHRVTGVRTRRQHATERPVLLIVSVSQFPVSLDTHCRRLGSAYLVMIYQGRIRVMNKQKKSTVGVFFAFVSFISTPGCPRTATMNNPDPSGGLAIVHSVAGIAVRRYARSPYGRQKLLFRKAFLCSLFDIAMISNPTIGLVIFHVQQR